MAKKNGIEAASHKWRGYWRSGNKRQMAKWREEEILTATMMA